MGWIAALVLGAIVGSFLNVCIDRLPRGESVVAPASHCEACGRRLSPAELIPIVSYLALGGQCRTCGERIPARTLAVEAGTALLFMLIWLRFQDSLATPVAAVYACFLIVMACIDLGEHRIPNVVSYPAIGLGLLGLLLFPARGAIEHLIGGLAGGGILFLIALIAPGGMGMGDVKLTVFLGLIVGFPQVLLVLFLAFVGGGLIAGGLLLAKVVDRRDPIAFGPFLAAAGFVTLLYGGTILAWWINRI